MADNTQITEVEETFEEPIAKLPTTVNMEGLKSKFFTSNLVELKTELTQHFTNSKLKVFDAVYKYNDDYDGKPEFVVNNLLRGFIRQLEDQRKYLFVVFKCTKTDGNYRITGTWITNCMLPLEQIVPDKYEDFDWTQVETNDEAVATVMDRFAKKDEFNVVYLH